MTLCETCAFFDYDEEQDCDVCTVNQDEDDLYRFLSGGGKECPYYRAYDEYKMVRRQN
ncbi:MAG: hypothetical protein IKD72_06625 [Clostridia bacterium]|nr:hypothetical protein [Clostridia bacterium]